MKSDRLCWPYLQKREFSWKRKDPYLLTVAPQTANDFDWISSFFPLVTGKTVYRSSDVGSCHFAPPW
jgi:hypothetical protein